MRKVVFISLNKGLIEDITEAVSKNAAFNIQLLSISHYGQVKADIEVFGADTVIIDMLDAESIENAYNLCSDLEEMRSMRVSVLALVNDVKTSAKCAFVDTYMAYENPGELFTQLCKMQM